MGGHGALVCALRNPTLYSSASAFAPICHPRYAFRTCAHHSACPWGTKAFTGYLGPDQSAWAVCCLLQPFRNIFLLRLTSTLLSRALPPHVACSWQTYDATELARAYSGPRQEFLVDQGTADKFLAEQLKPIDFVRACAESGLLRVRTPHAFVLFLSVLRARFLCVLR